MADEEQRQPKSANISEASGHQERGSRVDWDVALDVVAGDPDLLVQVLDAFRVEVAQMLRSIHDALEAEDSKLLHRAAHTAKNAFYNIGARETGDLAFEVEKLGKSESLDQVPPLLKQLEAHAAEIDQEVGGYLRENRRG